MQTLDVDVILIGGGSAGLWLLNRLRGQGYRAVLFEHKALGSDQTVASQGMIHGGIKYTLSGALSGASEAIAAMPEHWRRCLRGEGDVDLRGTSILSDHFYLWSASSAAAKLTTFFASKATRGRVDRVASRELPALLQNPGFRGVVYKLVDIVLDIPEVLGQLAKQARDSIYHIDWQRSHFDITSDGQTPALVMDTEAGGIRLNSRALIFSAGQGNEHLLQSVGASTPVMQRRPLQQVMVKHKYPHRFYGHCLGTESTPRLTISSHPCGDGSQVWYLGGNLAEKGADMAAGALIDKARSELNALLPWVDLSDAQWATLPVDRAEPRQRNLARPDQAFADWAKDCNNVIAAWPTKLTLAPNLGNAVIALLQGRDIIPSHEADKPPLALPLARPPIAPTPWQSAFD